MSDYLFDQLRVVRGNTTTAIKDLGESQADNIPIGFNNNIRWNLGHVYLVQERFAFGFTEIPMQLPEGFMELFGKDTKPSDWKTQPPTLTELTQLLEDQTNRIQETFSSRLDEVLAKPWTMPSGLTLKTVREFLTFSMYHEGMHVQMIKMLKRFSA
ncbi:DinB family protein [Desulfosporosinus sp. SB140]|uniref:DinB family protein n=1 Tax=Desulfosporosinus paludis TaxID=3115649 RepID=UPI00388E9827